MLLDKSALSWINGKDLWTWSEKYLMVDDYMLGKVLDKIKEILDVDKLPDDTTLKDVVISFTCVIKNDDKFYPQIFLEETFWVGFLVLVGNK